MKIRGGPTPVYPQGLSNVVFSWIFFRSFCRVKCWQSVRSEYLQATYGQYILSAPSKKSRPWGVFFHGSIVPQFLKHIKSSGVFQVFVAPNEPQSLAVATFDRQWFHHKIFDENSEDWPGDVFDYYEYQDLTVLIFAGKYMYRGGVVLGNASQMICCCFCKDFCKSFLGDLNLLSFIGFQMMWFMKKWEVHFTTGPKVCYDFVR